MNEKTWNEVKPKLLALGNDDLKEGVEWIDKVLERCMNIIKSDTRWNMNKEMFSLPEGVITIEYPKYMSKDSVADMTEFVNLVLKKMKKLKPEDPSVIR